jgi:hypothetical protein
MEMAAGFGVLAIMAIFWDISPPVFQRSMSPPYSCSKSKHVAGRKECCVLVSSLAYCSSLKMEVILIYTGILSVILYRRLFFNMKLNLEPLLK